MIISKRKAFRREPCNIRGTNLAAKRRDIRVAKIVGENEHDIGSIRLLGADESLHAQYVK